MEIAIATSIVEPLLKETPKTRTPVYYSYAPNMLYLPPEINEDTSLYRTPHQVSKVSTIEWFLK